MLSRRLLSSLVAIAALTGCDSTLRPGNADAVGTLLFVATLPGSGEYRLLLTSLSVRPEDDHANQIFLLASDATPVYIRKSGGSNRRASISELKPGAQILAQIGSDVVIDTDPAQYGASRIDAVQDVYTPDGGK